jgi:hypothetical protein
MKKLVPLITGLGMGLLALLAVFIFILQLRSNSALNKDLSSKKAELKDIQSASRKMEDLERKSQDLKQKENRMLRRVVVGDTQPLGLIKAITGSASKMGLRKISFDLKTASSGSGKDKKAAPAAGAGPQPVHFVMKFNATFPQALKFIKELYGLERIVSVEGIEMSRNKEILPYQSVTLNLAAYYFTE